MFCTGEKTQLPESGVVSPMKAHVAWLHDLADHWRDGAAGDVFLRRLRGGALFLGCALAKDGNLESGAEVFGKLVQLGVAVDLDGLLGGVADDVAVVAPGEMIFQFRLCAGVDGGVQVVGQFFKEIRARHFLPSPPLGFLKYLFSRSRNCKRARSSLDFTAGILRSKASAVSSVERPSTSRSTNTVRKLAGSPCTVLRRMSLSSPCL